MLWWIHINALWIHVIMNSYRVNYRLNSCLQVWIHINVYMHAHNYECIYLWIHIQNYEFIVDTMNSYSGLPLAKFPNWDAPATVGNRMSRSPHKSLSRSRVTESDWHTDVPARCERLPSLESETRRSLSRRRRLCPGNHWLGLSPGLADGKPS
jgi:hypothetical protein